MFNHPLPLQWGWIDSIVTKGICDIPECFPPWKSWTGTFFFFISWGENPHRFWELPICVFSNDINCLLMVKEVPKPKMTNVRVDLSKSILNAIIVVKKNVQGFNILKLMGPYFQGLLVTLKSPTTSPCLQKPKSSTKLASELTWQCVSHLRGQKEVQPTLEGEYFTPHSLFKRQIYNSKMWKQYTLGKYLIWEIEENFRVRRKKRCYTQESQN